MLSILVFVLFLNFPSNISSSKALTFQEIKSRFIHQYYLEIERLQGVRDGNLYFYTINFKPILDSLKNNFDPVAILQYFIDDRDDFYLARVWAFFNPPNNFLFSNLEIGNDLNSFMEALTAKNLHTTLVEIFCGNLKCSY
jgi:hypothetical protein